MEKLVLVIHVIAALGVIALVLLQHGKGADMGASFGSGASGSLFGVSGSANFMSRATAVFVLIFFTTSLTLAYMSSHKEGGGSVVKVLAEKSAVVNASSSAAKTDAVTPPVVPAQDIPK
ncbi:preprotein translocase subunit SecG [Methylotenera sp.]|uniref:preprotein translocase subunit SecG n=1 Tax=Methylotenera sp. TaxID=2051956 RepID=UPI0024870CE3|nr:preprotein translocase subunit SecG [Methylotenera sp.]MDI1362168.1 preprotein translocase subunit SecG [Methylotenera sp.]